MDEKEKNEQEGTTENAKESSGEKNIPIIEQANALVERIEEGNKRQEELLNRQEEIIAKEMLGGYTEAGKEEIKKEEETPEEYANKIMRGEVNPLV